MRELTVLSLFDGIACGYVALERAGIKVRKYYASEINEKSIKVAKKNYPDIIELGDVKTMDITGLDKIDLLLCGSPCQDLSGCKPDGKGLNGEKSVLFFEFVKILKEVKPIWFLFENVVMKEEWQNIISNLLGIAPFRLDSKLVSAQNRTRLYWTNIPCILKLIDKGILIKDIIFDDNFRIFTDERIDRTRIFTKNYIKWDISGKGYWSQQDRAYFKNGKCCTVPKANPCNKLNIWLGENRYRRMHPVEAERLQTLPDNYTDCIKSVNERIGLVGDGWTVDVIVHIFKGLL